METIGQRMLAWRRRRGGMTQQVLAARAGFTPGYISKIEKGERGLHSRSAQVAIAAALDITVAQLLGQPDDLSQDPAQQRASRFVPAVRSALVSMGAGERVIPVRSVDDVRAAVVSLNAARVAADYVTVAADLPALLGDLAGYGNELGAETVEALFAGRSALKAMGYVDLAREAASIGRSVAEAYGDPAWIGQAYYSWVVAFPPESAGLGSRLAAKAADDIQGLTDRVGRETYGMLHLVTALQAAIENRAGDAWAHWAEASDVADALGEPTPYASGLAGVSGQWFGPTNLCLWEMALAAELQDTGRAESVQRRVDLSLLPVANRLVYYWTDLARALAAGGQDQAAMLALANAERAAPLHFRLNPVACDLVGLLLKRAQRRAVPGELSTLARKVGLSPM